MQVSYTPSSVGSRERPLVLTDKATIAAYKPLTVAQPSSGKTLLGIDSSIQVVWSGGPLPWVKKPEYHFSRLTVKDPQVATAGKRVQLGPQSVGGAAYAFEVTCVKVGTTEVTLEVGNRVSGTLQRPVTASSTVTVECGQPGECF